jgi:hypothetical protein
VVQPRFRAVPFRYISFAEAQNAGLADFFEVHSFFKWL